MKNRRLDGILDLIYPRRCPVCDRVLAFGGGPVCLECRPKLSVMEGSHCDKCGKFLKEEEQQYCEDCRRRTHDFEEGLGIFPYHSWVRDSMARFKFHGRVEYGAFYGRMMARAAKGRIEKWRPQVIVPIPMYRGKQKKRGYNQAEILAREMGKYLNLPVRNDLIRRRTDTIPQKELADPGLRRENLKKAFQAGKEAGRYERILLTDDIYTTGSTADAVSKELKRQGVKEVYFVTACTGTGF